MKKEEMDRIDVMIAEGLEFRIIHKSYYTKDAKYICAIKDWSPTRKIKQAFEVIAQLEKQGAEVTIYKTKSMIFYNGLWYEGLGKVRQEHMMKAALKALGLEIPGDERIKGN